MQIILNSVKGKKPYYIYFLHSNEEFKSFGFKKIIFIVTNYEELEEEKSYHPNILIDNNTTFDSYWKEIGEHV